MAYPPGPGFPPGEASLRAAARAAEVHAPRSPTREVWASLSPTERAAWLERLGPMPADALPPIGDPHIDAERTLEDTLSGWFERRRTRAYVGRGLTVYYPGEQRFAPDLFVVFDVPEGKRTVWLVVEEGRGLDFALEVHHRGDRRKGMEENVERYAALGIPEYFVYDVGRRHVYGWRLAPGASRYTPIVPQAGRWRSEVLGADFGVVDGLARLFVDGAMQPVLREVQNALVEALDAAIERAEDAERRAIDAERVAAEAKAEAERVAAEAEKQLEALRAELARLRGG
jgi:Uma2 family endonuclease